ncbi:hypothetical protein JRQ81_011123 [Phrynocephalus forsythii]|uniref:Glycerol-3-phosphate acyltransferase 4 n=1 Tax=Phrynocephalus forsythii TaxID=171643 RepID=A0A9Q0X7I1_9SAUR|nr:hypothetical protein JRQ81_011123 [Phrynocephalus forsythii]
MFLLLPFDSLVVNLLGISLTVLFTLLLVFIIVPAIFGVSFGIRRLYMKTLLQIFQWATLRIERGAKEKKHPLYRPYVNGIIAKEPTSLEEEIKEIRRSGSSKALDAPEFELSDVFYFCRKGIETIMDDEVTKRFSAEELESWNLLSRTNYNFHYISLRLTVLWGLGVLMRYCFLLPLSKHGMVTYLLRMMTSWAIVCSVWYLPPMTRKADEDAVQFANRVKSAIARQGGLVDLLWDGGLKREKVKDTFKEEQQKLYSKMVVGNHKDRSRS